MPRSTQRCVTSSVRQLARPDSVSDRNLFAALDHKCAQIPLTVSYDELRTIRRLARLPVVHIHTCEANLRWVIHTDDIIDMFISVDSGSQFYIQFIILCRCTFDRLS